MTTVQAKVISKLIWHFIKGEKVEVLTAEGWKNINEVGTGFIEPICYRLDGGEVRFK